MGCANSTEISTQDAAGLQRGLPPTAQTQAAKPTGKCRLRIFHVSDVSEMDHLPSVPAFGPCKFPHL